MRVLSEHSDFQRKEKEQLHAHLSTVMDQQTSHELRQQDLSNQVVTLRNRLEATTTELNHMIGEKGVISASEARLAAENAELVAQRNLATEHLKRLQGMFEEAETRRFRALEKTKELQKGYEEKISALRAQISTAGEEFNASKSRLESEVKELQLQIERLTSQLHESTQECSALKESEQQLSKTIEVTKTELATCEESLARYTSRESVDTSGSTAEVTLLALQEDLASTKAKLQTAQSTLVSQKADIEQYKSIAMAAEEKLIQKVSEFETTFASYREESDAKLTELQLQHSSLEQSRLESETKLSQALEELADQRTQIDKDQIEFLLERSRMEDEMMRVKSSEDSMHKTYQTVSNEVKRLKQRLADAKMDYEKVILMEGERIKTLERLREEVLEGKKVAVAMQERTNAAEQALQLEQSTSTARISELENELHALKEHNRDLASQNSNLHSQFDALSAKLGSMHQASGSSSFTSLDADTASSIQESERANLIRHLRREKEILEKENELALQKVNRMQGQMDHLQRSLDDARAVLNTERQKSLSNSDSARVHAELMSKIDRVNTLTESNTSLRSQNKSLSSRILSLELKIKQKETEVGPLR
ncbi:hypothetical protein HDU98_004315, partial [Podochytrium sp. JEL0797]